MDFGEVLQKAWRIIWKHKVLWLFGILAGCGSAGNSGGSSSGYRFNSGGGGGSRGNLPEGWQTFFQQLQRTLENIPAWVWILLAALLFALFIALIFINTIGRIGLVRGASLADEGAMTLGFGELFNGSLSYFWRVFLLNLLIGLAFLVIILVLTIPLILLTIGTLGIALLCLIPLACLLIPVMWVVGVIIEQANIALIVENLGILAAVQRGWDVVRRNLGAIIVMALILFIGGAIAGLVIAIPLVFLLVPPLVGMAAGNQGLGAGLVISLVLFVIYLPIALVLGGILRAYITTSWTLTFRRLTGRTALGASLPTIVPPPSMEPQGS
ncbi:MAG: hypothetical protein PHQ40_18320 [Anaerolineaceae bacterium]|nr:hypothetical protein [Anaerolineaceae bacterium]